MAIRMIRIGLKNMIASRNEAKIPDNIRLSLQVGLCQSHVSAEGVVSDPYTRVAETDANKAHFLCLLDRKRLTSSGGHVYGRVRLDIDVSGR
jgi:hypothetical protein